MGREAWGGPTGLWAKGQGSRLAGLLARLAAWRGGRAGCWPAGRPGGPAGEGSGRGRAGTRLRRGGTGRSATRGDSTRRTVRRADGRRQGARGRTASRSVAGGTEATRGGGRAAQGERRWRGARSREAEGTREEG